VIYLDFNRTTPLAPSALDAMQPFWVTHFLLPNQEHPHAQAISEALERAREGVAMIAGCDPFEIVFTGGATEANNLAILGGLKRKPSGHVLVSALEHESVLAAVESIRGSDWEIEVVPCTADGIVDPEAVHTRLRRDTRMVCIVGASPSLGTIQPVREIADICHNQGIHVHCDASQMFGKLPVYVSQLRADTVAMSGHKFYGPKGTGALFVRRGLQLAPILHGESREMGLRPGAENVPGYVGLGTVASLASRCAADVATNLATLRDRLITGLRQVLDPEPILLCEHACRLANTLTVEMPVDAKRLQRTARELVLTTAQCDSPPDELTRALRAIGRNDAQIGRTLRISLGWTTSRETVDRAVELLAEAWDSVRV
jgi:cysteine desulfurase